MNNVSLEYRTEHDFLGERKIHQSCYFGIQTQRAIENFPITEVPISHFSSFIIALAEVKKAAARANFKLGLLEKVRADAIIFACERIIKGEFHDQFLVDCIQGGAGTSTNMNMNEVVANVGLEMMGKSKGSYEFLHPNNDVNLGQSTNDVYPTALNIALHVKVETLNQNISKLVASIRKKANEFQDVLKMGRTQLQDAVPMSLGQEFEAFASSLEAEVERYHWVQDLLLEVNLGGTAIGTGINALKKYDCYAIGYLSEQTGLALRQSSDLIRSSWDQSTLIQLSSICKRTCIKLSKIANDLRLLSSGPRCGFGEVNLPQMQPGSSIMPGKINPVIPEVVNQVCFDVFGADTTITFACEAGQLQLNVMVPLVTYRLFQSLKQMSNVVAVFQESCMQGLTANVNHCRDMVNRSVGIVTVLSPLIGYEAASRLSKRALTEGTPLRDLVLEEKLATREELDFLLKPENMVHPDNLDSFLEHHQKRGRL